MDNENYFENIAKGKIKVDTETEAESEVALTENTGGDFEVELAKAETSSPTALSTSTKTKNSGWEDDGEPEGQLTIDVYQTPEDIVVESAIAGVKPEDIDVNVTRDSISIRGTRRHGKEVKDSDYIYQECYWGRFARSIILPQEVDPEAAEVMFKNGILTVRLPKVNKKKSKKLKVRTD